MTTSRLPLLSPTEIAAELNCYRDSVLRAIKRGHLPALRYDRLTRVERADLGAFLARYRTRNQVRRRSGR